VPCDFNQLATAVFTSSSLARLWPERWSLRAGKRWKSLGARSGLYGGCSKVVHLKRCEILTVCHIPHYPLFQLDTIWSLNTLPPHFDDSSLLSHKLRLSDDDSQLQEHAQHAINELQNGPPISVESPCFIRADTLCEVWCAANWHGVTIQQYCIPLQIRSLQSQLKLKYTRYKLTFGLPSVYPSKYAQPKRRYVCTTRCHPIEQFRYHILLSMY